MAAVRTPTFREHEREDGTQDESKEAHHKHWNPCNSTDASETECKASTEHGDRGEGGHRQCFDVRETMDSAVIGCRMYRLGCSIKTLTAMFTLDRICMDVLGTEGAFFRLHELGWIFLSVSN